MLLPTNIKLYTAFPLVYLHLTMDWCKGQGQGHVQFHCQYLANSDRYCKHCYCQKIESHMWTLITGFKFDLGLFILNDNLPFSNGTGRHSTTTLSGTIYSRRLSSLILPTIFLHYSTRTTRRFVRWSTCTSWQNKSSIINVHLRLGSIIVATRRRLSHGDLSGGTDARITAMTFACGATNWTSNASSSSRNMHRFGRGLSKAVVTQNRSGKSGARCPTQ